MSEEKKTQNDKKNVSPDDKDGKKAVDLPPPKKAEPLLMKKGDYTIHLLIEEIKNISGKNPDFLPKPVVKVTCLNETKRTSKVSDGCSEYTFNEHIYFEKTDLPVEILDSAKVVIEVYDYNNSKREDYFGIYEFDFEYVYNSENHSIKNLWIALANPEAEDITKVRGYLKLSVSILREDDERIELNPDPSKDNECMIPPQIKVEYKQVSIYVYKAEELPDMDSLTSEKKVGRECQGYVECHYMGIVKKTKIIDMKNEIISWNEIIDVPVSQPAISQKMVFFVKDHNKMTKDKVIGSFEISIDDIMGNKYEKLQAINLYGSSVIDNSSISNMMNTNAEIGSRWKGRVYLQIKYTSSDNPISGTRSIDDQALITSVYNTPRSNLWSVYVKLFDTYYLPTKNDKYGIKICLQDNIAVYDNKKAENRNIKWNLCKTLQCQTLTDSKFELPDLFIYLVNEKKQNICFQRIKASEFHMNNAIMMIKLIPDPCIGKVKEMYLSGIVKIKIKIFNRAIDKEPIDLSDFKDGDGTGYVNSEGDLEDDLEKIYSESSNVVQKESNLKPHTIVANFYMSRYLVPGDSNGMSDPYAVLSIYQEKKQTKVKDNCVNGIWNESLIFENIMMDINDKTTWPVMLLTVMDKDVVSSDMLGYSYVWLTDSPHNINSIENVRPKWQQLYLEKSNRAQGQVLISFNIFDEGHQSMAYQINIEPETVPYSVEINALGLRDLKPLSFLPVKKPFISFDINSINVSGKKEDTLTPIKTQPKDSGANPNINTVIKFDVKLPKEEIFIPEMQCEVYDHVLGGMLNQLLGIFMLSVKSLIRETHRTIDKDIKITKEKIEQMKNNSKPKAIDVGLVVPNQELINKSGEKLIDDTGDNPTSKNEMKELESKPLSDDKVINIDNDNPLKVPLVKDEKEKGLNDSVGSVERFNEGNLVCKTSKDLNKLYTGIIDNQFIMEHKNDSDYFVLKPSFKTYTLPGVKKGDKEYREYLIENDAQIPSDSYYFPIGFNKRQNDYRAKLNQEEESKKMNINENNKKHYSRIFGKELEKVEELGLACPFFKSRLVRGKYVDEAENQGIFDAMKRVDSKILKKYAFNEKAFFKAIVGNQLELIEDEQQELKNMSESFDIKPYGKFKGLVRIAKKEKMREYEEFVQKVARENGGSIPKEFHYLTKFDELSKNILIRRSVIIRLYVLELKNLAKKDAFSESDPYIIIKVGNEEKINEKENKIDDKKDCRWYKYYDILSELPGNSTLTIQVMDYDPIFSDELIGETSIDIEDRYFDQKWRDITNKPIEIRQLHHPDYPTSQGQISMWMEIFDKDQRAEMTPWNIEPEPESELELRLIVWETENMECMDIEDTSDIYVIGYVDPKEKQSTDIHFRCQNGNASFNWRLLLPIKLPTKKYDLIFQVYDNDILARDDFICGGKLNLYRFIRDANTLDIPVVFNRDYQNSLPVEDKFQNVEFLPESEDKEGTKFWVQMYKGGMIPEKKGRVLCSLEMLPKWKAEMTPVGKGRDEPNVNPYLPPPVGRIQFTLNPFKMFNQLVGPKFRRKCCLAICCTLLVIYLIFVIPYIIYHLGGEAVNPFNHIRKK